MPLVKARTRIHKDQDKRLNQGTASRHPQLLWDRQAVAYSSWDQRHNRCCASKMVVWFLGRRRACSTHMLSMATLMSSLKSSLRMAQLDKIQESSPSRIRSTFSPIKSRLAPPPCLSNKLYAHLALTVMSLRTSQQQIRAVKRLRLID